MELFVSRHAHDRQVILLLLAALSISGAVVGGPEQNTFPHPTEAATYAKRIWAVPLVVTTVIALIKISTLLLWKRIFVKPDFRLVCNVVIGFTLGWFLAFVFAQIFSSRPVSRGWKDPGHNDLSEPVFQLSMAAINLTLDVVTVCLPLFVIRTLHMSTRKKVLIMGVFSLGFFCIVASAVRLHYLVHLKDTPNSPDTPFSSDIAQVTVWSFIEPCASIIAACLPTLAPVFKGGLNLQSLVRSVRSLFSLRSHFSSRSRNGKGTAVTESESKEAKSAWKKLYSAPNHTTQIIRGSDTELSALPQSPTAIKIQTSWRSEVQTV